MHRIDFHVLLAILSEAGRFHFQGIVVGTNGRKVKIPAPLVLVESTAFAPRQIEIDGSPANGSPGRYSPSG